MQWIWQNKDFPNFEYNASLFSTFEKVFYRNAGIIIGMSSHLTVDNLEQLYVKWAAMVTIFILVMGIVMIHFKEGWFVVGGGRNGVEFNFLLIVVVLALWFPNGLRKNGR
ncbi:DUF4172 domain-containing protein [Runella sp.]|uniref:DUF4172 domain-containing protein n=1 Tax=Runella sp. TaxID=1960881 RepID=UPI003D0D6FA4